MHWMLVTSEFYHLLHAKEYDETWWCVDKRCKPKDKAFLFKINTGIVLYFEILELTEAQPRCKAYGMGTAKIKVINIFRHPITAKKIKSIITAKAEQFVAKNFHGKSFMIKHEKTPNVIMSMDNEAGF